MVLIWIEKFLINRCQCVRVGNVLSEYADVVSGDVGSVLGPVLFIVFINDMCNCIPGSTVLKLFADDAKLYSGDGTCGDLQTCLSTVFKWSESQQLRLARLHLINASRSLSAGTRPGSSFMTSSYDVIRKVNLYKKLTSK